MSDAVILDPEAPDPPWRHGSEGEMSRARRGAFRRLTNRTPLRTKLIVALLGLVIMALAAIGVASTYIARESLIRQHDGDIESVINHPGQVGYAINHMVVGSAITTQSPIVVGLQVPGQQLTWSQTGFGLGSADPLPRLPARGVWTDATLGDVSPIFSASAQSGPNTWRVTAETAECTNQITELQTACMFVVAEDIGNINALTMRLVLFDLAVGSAIVIFLAVVGIAVVRTNLRPLNDIELTAGQIAQGHLDHRVPEGDPRTEIGSLGRSLNAMLNQIERAFHAQEASEQAAHESEERMRRFIADASHELRTPLTTIRGFAAHYRMRGGAGGGRGGVGVGVGAAGGAGAAVGGGVGFGGGAADQSSRTDALVPDSANGIFPSGPANDDGMSPGDLDHLIGRVEAEATRMGLLVEDLLMLARLDQQRPLNVAPVDLLTLAADAVQDARIVSPDRSIDLIVAPGTAFLVDGDEPRLRQVLGNLVNNALTHTPAGTPVRVKIASGTLTPTADGRSDGLASAGGDGFAGGAGNGAGAGGRPVPAVASADGDGFAGGAGNGAGAGGRPVPAVASADGDGFAGGAGNGAGASGRPVPAVVLDVEDDGPGMPAEQAQRVFERFYRADAARNRASGGTGLGLAIVAGLVNAHGGTVSVRTTLGRGADFQVLLPLSPDALAPSDDPDDTLSD
jgi:two-component system, OmpR family, sensor kinase